ncbi:hypothetical protein MTP41_13445 [Faecalibacterium sp. I4-3-84]|uniref:hypothetical protein n=1 Tax=Faecalibacterium sp. I4-3-84 TaxID=2929495 RepID=UPI002014DF5E|nr:hypothetical protein MTP41_13445 [Faecalibacterium sp. I4-3-84]
MKLFAIGNGSVSDYLRSNISSLKDKIASYTDEQIMNSDFDEWVEYLTKKYQVEPITFFVNATTRSLHETTIQQYNPWSRMGSAYGEPEYYNLDGYNIDFKIPFAGDSVLLKCQPSTYTFTSYEIVDFQRSTESSYGYITIRLSYTNQEIKSFGEQLEEKIDTAFKNRFKNFEETSGYVNNEVRSYNEQLESTVRQLLNERKNKASDFFSISKALKIPLNLNSSAPNLTPIPLKKPHRANLNEPKQHAPEKQFLKRNGRGCDDNRLVHAFAVQQHRHKIAKGLSNAHASFNRKMLIVYEGVHNLKGHILLPFTHFQAMLRGFIPKEGADLLTHGVQLCFSALFPFLRCIESKIESVVHPYSSRNRNQGYPRFSSMLTFPFSSIVSVMCLMCFS